MHGLTFPVVATLLGAQVFGNGVTAAAIKPAHNRAVFLQLARQRGCLAGQIGENTLGDLLGDVGGANLSQHGGINQVGVTRDDFPKSRLRSLAGIFAEQLCVGLGLHLTIIHPPKPKSDNANFAF